VCPDAKKELKKKKMRREKSTIEAKIVKKILPVSQVEIISWFCKGFY